MLSKVKIFDQMITIARNRILFRFQQEQLGLVKATKCVKIRHRKHSLSYYISLFHFHPLHEASEVL